MIRNDGTFRIYCIQHEQLHNGAWLHSSVDYFGCPEGFNASGKCWQRTGVHGVFNLKQARLGLAWIQARWPGRSFRLVRITITQTTEVVA